MPTHKTIDQKFKEDAANRGLQPSYRTKIRPKRSNMEQLYQQGLSRPSYLSQQSFNDRNPISAGAVNVTYGPRTQRTRSSQMKAVKSGRRPKQARKAFTHSRVTAVNFSILSWGMAVWILQFQLAVVGIVAFGGAGAIEAIQSNAAGKFVITGVDFVFETFTAAASTILGANVSVGLLDSIETMVFISLALTWLTGLATLLAMGIQYEMFRMHSLYGEGAALKISAVILALIGYFIPIANLFPWFIFWCLAVWRYPK